MSGFAYDRNATNIAENPTFVAQASDVVIGNNKSMLSIVNTSSTVIVKVREIYLVNAQNTAVTGVTGSFSLLRITGHSSGTSITAGMHDTTQTLDAGVTVRTGSTVSGEDATIYRRWKFSTDEWAQGAQDVESMDHVSTVVRPVFYQAINSKPITLRQNQGLHVKHTVNSTAGSFDIVVIFTTEEAGGYDS
jgi:hypothetical protein